ADGIAPGVRVVAGQQLGLTGKSGDARFTDSHLHFGISHPTAPDDWKVRRGEISPYNYLRAWQRGEDATPQFKVKSEEFKIAADNFELSALQPLDSRYIQPFDDCD
ncbi:MAG: hypothetical protein ABIV47_09275, partial [Roseiflexaceae bacterium]